MLAQGLRGGKPDLAAGGRYTPRRIEFGDLPTHPVGGRPHRDGADAIAERIPPHVGEHHAFEMGGGLLSAVHAQHVSYGRCPCIMRSDDHATRRWKRSLSTLPPESTATATLPLRSILPASRAANATARVTSSSLAQTPSPTSVRLIAKVSSPGVRAIRASQIVPVAAALLSRSPLRNERAWSSKFSGSAVNRRACGTRALTASATPALSPPPEAVTTITSGTSPNAARSSTISRPVVPCPAMICASSYGGTKVALR